MKVFLAHQAEISLIDQRGGLQRLTRRQLGHSSLSQPVQLRVEERQELGDGFLIAGLGRVQDLGHHSGLLVRHFTISLRNFLAAFRLNYRLGK
jgi:hypothetical protein